MHSRALFLLLLVMCVFDNVKGQSSVYCSPDRHQFYVQSGDICKKCDKCIPGWGLEPEQNATIVMSEHGALGCRKCEICDKGYFNRWRSYDACKKCKDCASLGRTIKIGCTRTRNTKCGRKLPVVIESTKGMKPGAINDHAALLGCSLKQREI